MSNQTAYQNSENLKLWNSTCETDPSITSKAGRFTAIDAYSQIRTATEMWGPYGGKWKLEDIKTEIIEDNGSPIGMISWFNFVYPGGSFHISSDVTFSRKAQKGDFSNLNDSSKKIRTDALTKALSYLGFNADVFLGKFDDNKYVEKIEKKIQREKKELVAAVERDAMQDYTDWVEKIYYPGLENCSSIEALRGFMNQHKEKLKLLQSEDGESFKNLLKSIVEAKDNRKYQLEETSPDEDNLS
jgi:hypothetical protein